MVKELPVILRNWNMDWDQLVAFLAEFPNQRLLQEGCSRQKRSSPACLSPSRGTAGSPQGSSPSAFQLAFVMFSPASSRSRPSPLCVSSPLATSWRYSRPTILIALYFSNSLSAHTLTSNSISSNLWSLYILKSAYASSTSHLRHRHAAPAHSRNSLPGRSRT